MRSSAALAAIAALLATTSPAAADPDPAIPNGAAPAAAAANPAGPAPIGAPPGPAPMPGAPPVPGAPPNGVAPLVGAAPPIDDGKVISSPPATLTATDGAVLTLSGEDEVQRPIAPLTTAISTREYDVGGVFRGSVTGTDQPPKGVLEVGYQIGCGIDMGTGPGVLIGGNLGANASYGLLDGGALGLGIIGIPNAGITVGGSVTVSLKPGIVNNVPVTKKQFKGDAPRVSIRNFRVRIDGCVGESFIRSFAILDRSTDERETILAWYGESKRV